MSSAAVVIGALRVKFFFRGVPFDSRIVIQYLQFIFQKQVNCEVLL